MHTKKNNYHTTLCIMMLMLTTLSSCMQDDLLWEQNPWPMPAAVNGLFIINEGNFMFNNASLSFYEPQTGQIHNDVFFSTNGFPLGDVAQSMIMHQGQAYIIINNSGRIYIMNPETMAYEDKITGFTSPRHIHFISHSKAYVTDLYAQCIYIVDTEEKEIIGKINVSAQEEGFYRHSTDKMVQVGKYVFVNAWSYDNSILVIDAETDTWIHTIEVSRQPQSLILDRDDNLWVLSDGGYPGSPYEQEPGALSLINTENFEVELVYHFPLEDSPRNLSINSGRDTLYFLNRHAYRQHVFSELHPERIIESPYGDNQSGGFYAMTLDPVTSEIYIADAIDLVQAGLVYRYTPSLEPVDTFRVGIIPGDFAFRRAD